LAVSSQGDFSGPSAGEGLQNMGRSIKGQQAFGSDTIAVCFVDEGEVEEMKKAAQFQMNVSNDVKNSKCHLLRPDLLLALSVNIAPDLAFHDLPCIPLVSAWRHKPSRSCTAVPKARFTGPIISAAPNVAKRPVAFLTEQCHRTFPS
jgi:hypothetical protein